MPSFILDQILSPCMFTLKKVFFEVKPKMNSLDSQNFYVSHVVCSEFYNNFYNMHIFPRQQILVDC